MTEFNYGGSEEENAEIRRLNVELEADTDSFETWEKLVRASEALDGGLNRNSTPLALETMRDTYDRFLLKFPLLFGYWKKYADFEFNISGPEAAEMVYERGCASITNSVDLWAEFCSFKMQTTHEPQLVRELLERAADHVGLDFLAHPFWDRYLEYEERLEATDNVFAILKRIIQIPMHQYARYFERFRQLSQARPVTELVAEETLSQIRAEVDAEIVQYGVAKTEAEIEVAVRAKIDALFYETFTKTQVETNKRWTFEAEIKRPYFHVTELDHQQLANWRKYLDFEEAEGDAARVVFLYERCLVTCAFYEEFWLRYTRWMAAQPGKDEDVRHVFLRAATVFVPVSRPAVRLQFAYSEESHGRVDVARAIHSAVLEKLPNSVEVIVSWANLERRQAGLDAAIDVFKQQIDSPAVDLFVKAVLVTEWAYMLWKVKGSVDDARTVFEKNVQWYADSRQFWWKWFDFELWQPSDAATEAQNGERIDHVVTEMLSRSRLPFATKKEICQVYMTYLQQRGGKDSMKKFLEIDRDTLGPTSVLFSTKQKLKAKENSEAIADLDEATLLKGNTRYLSYYEAYADAEPAAQGLAPFN
ncbi:mRNA splicing protein [Niveomyces insectorum RCEF 264]|uniref:mRNA splicing protein n=1 Tax=Niveomyces insectorum RCEF 264 TaxID=1081102 RepID=A0A167ZAS4_9HYPO|nr:mRNA splicing protein [Niveomyces insectorum RCEF 264]